MYEFWKRLTAFLGLGLPPEERQPVVQKAPAYEAPDQDAAPACWALGFDSVLPGMRGYAVLPVNPGHTVTVLFGAITFGGLIGKLEHLEGAAQAWPVDPSTERGRGHLGLEGPGWSINTYYDAKTQRFVYQVERAGGAGRISGEACPELLVQALLLCPQYEKVVGYLKLSPYLFQKCGV